MEKQIKFNYSRNKATVVIEGNIYNFELSNPLDLQKYILKYNYCNSEFWLGKIKKIIDKTKVVKVKDYTKKLEKTKLEQEVKEVSKVSNYFKDSNYFDVDKDVVKLKGLDFGLPQKFLNITENMEEKVLLPYINFMYNLSDNPNEGVRNNIFDWIVERGFKITKNGYIFGVRYVVKVSEQSDLDKFVHSEYTRRKTQKKAPKNYVVVGENNVYFSVKDTGDIKNEVGNLEKLFVTSLKDEVVFTDNYTKTMRIVLGNPVKIPRSQCDDSQTQCSSGLHWASLKDIDNINFGDTLITVLVHPKNIVSLPHDSYRKARCCEYFPYSVIQRSDVKELMESDSIINDVDYETINVEQTFKALEGKSNLYKTNEDRIKFIKEKLKEFKTKKEEVEIDLSNRIIHL